MTEPHLRELFAWLDAHRASLIDLAGELAEHAAQARGLDLAMANPLQLKAMALASALSELERIYPSIPDENEITEVGLPAPDPDADTVPGVPPPRSPRRLTGGPA